MCCALVAIALPAEASSPKRAKFRVTVTGMDQSSWNYRFRNRCPGTGSTDVVGTGSETIRYTTARPVVISARPPRGGSKLELGLDRTASRPRLGPGPEDGARFQVRATITRQTTVTPCSDGDPPTSSDCGTKSFSILGNLRFLGAARLGFFSMAASRRYPFSNCPNYFGRARGSVGVGTREAGGRLSTKTLFNRRKRRFTVTGRSFSRSPSYGADHRSNWKATFRRIR
jgi:hypothetical protein